MESLSVVSGGRSGERVRRGRWTRGGALRPCKLLPVLLLLAALPARAEGPKLIVDDGEFHRDSFTRQLALSREDRYVLVSDSTSGVSFYDSRTGELQNRFSGHALEGEVYYDAGSDLFLTTGDKTARLWDVGRHVELRSSRQGFHSQFMNAVYIDPGKQFFFAQNVKYKLESGKQVKRYGFPERFPNQEPVPGLFGMHFFADRYVVFDRSGAGTLYDLSSDENVGAVQLRLRKEYLSFHIDPRRGEAYLGTTEGFSIVDLRTGKEGFLRFDRKNAWKQIGYTAATCVTGDGRYFVAASELSGGHLVVLEKIDASRPSFVDNAREIYRSTIEVSELQCLSTRPQVVFAMDDSLALLDIPSQQIAWRKSSGLLNIHRLALDATGKQLGIEFGEDPHQKAVSDAWKGDAARYFETSPRESYLRRFRSDVREADVPPPLRRFFRKRVRFATVGLDGSLAPKRRDSLADLPPRTHNSGGTQHPQDQPVPSPSGKRHIEIAHFKTAAIYEGSELLARAPARGVIYEVAWSSDESLVAFGGADRRATVVDLDKRKVLVTLTAPHYVTALSFTADKRRLIVGTLKNELWIFDLSTGKVASKLGGFNGQTRDLLLTKDERMLISVASDNVLRFWDHQHGKLLASAYFDTELGFAALTPEGYFDKSAQFSLLAWNNKGVRSSLDQFYEKFYRPDLVRAALAFQDLSSLPTVGQAGVPPTVEIAEAPREVAGREARITVGLTDKGSGIGDVRIYVNGTAIKVEKTRGMAVEGESGPVRRPYTVPLVAGRNEIRVRAFSADNSVQSDSVATVIVAQTPARPTTTEPADAAPSLHALVIGIDVYENPNLNLRFARADAELFAQSLETATKGLFARRSITTLTLPKDTTKQSILDALRRYEKLPAGDLFVFYIASHGVVDEGSYYLLPANVGSLSASKLHRDALSQEEITERIINIPAQKKLVVLDTCSAGALSNALQAAVLTRGLNQATAVKVLARAVGTTILSAATSEQEALEGYRGHGLFTFVVSESLKGKADLNRDGFVKTTELADYIDDEVPRLAEQIFGRKQFPTVAPSGQGFPVARLP